MAEKKVVKELPSHTIVIYQSPLGPDEIFHNSSRSRSVNRKYSLSLFCEDLV